MTESFGEHEALLIAGWLVATIFPFVIALAGLWVKARLEAIEQNQKELKQEVIDIDQKITWMQVEMPQKYSLKSDATLFREEIRESLRSITDLINGRFNELKEDLKGKVNK